ncbi:MAG: hypothetical protein M5U17_09035 [Ignavibacterium sp.]|nr:hypothetical protein [Ignavibacterium sp.]
MKKTIVWILIVTTLSHLTGCYTYREIGLTKFSMLSNDELDYKDIRIELLSGEEIFSKAYNHFFNDLDDDFILGQGTIYLSEKNINEIFSGKIYKDTIDSTVVYNNFYKIWLKNKNVVKIEINKYMEVSGDTAKGLVVMDDMKFRAIPIKEITSVVSSEHNPTLTVLVIVTGIVVISSIILLANITPFNLLGSLKE